MIKLEAETHAKLSPSGAHRWINCPGSIRLCADIEETTSAAAEEGTFAHHIAATALEQNVDAMEFLGQTDGVHTVDVDMADYLQQYLDVVRGFNGKLLVETRVFADDKDVNGTADAIVSNRKSLHVVDLKYGAGVYVEVEENPQLMIYALGALNATHHMFETVTMHIVQPRCSEPTHRSFEMPVGDLLFWQEFVLMPAVRATAKKNAELAAGEHCRFCDAKPICPALRQVATRRTREVFAAKTPPDPKLLTPEQIGEILETAPLVEMWLKSVREHAFAKLTSGTAVPGFKLVHRKSNREWEDEEMAECAGVPVVRKLMSPSQAEKRIGKKIVAELIAPQKQCTAMVRSDDKRDALPLSSPFEAQ